MCDGGGRKRRAGQARTADVVASPVSRMEVYVPTAPWRRRRVTDIPRPAGRRWAGRLRRGGSLARQVLAGHRPEAPTADLGTDSLAPRRRFTLRRGAAGRGG